MTAIRLILKNGNIIITIGMLLGSPVFTDQPVVAFELMMFDLLLDPVCDN